MRPLDRFIPQPDVVERFETTIRAPAEIVMKTAGDFDMQSSPLVKAIFWLRERVTGATGVPPRKPQGLLAETRSLGWGLLAEEAGRLVICGASCQPWEADVRFTPLEPEEFVEYSEPDRVKIAWSLEARPIDATTTHFAQETRVVANDREALAKFRRYWRWARFGIIAIRLLLLPAIRRTAEQRWRTSRSAN